jgi:hypothetical protein
VPGFTPAKSITAEGGREREGKGRMSMPRHMRRSRSCGQRNTHPWALTRWRTSAPRCCLRWPPPARRRPPPRHGWNPAGARSAAATCPPGPAGTWPPPWAQPAHRRVSESRTGPCQLILTAGVGLARDFGALTLDAPRYGASSSTASSSSGRKSTSSARSAYLDAGAGAGSADLRRLLLIAAGKTESKSNKRAYRHMIGQEVLP